MKTMWMVKKGEWLAFTETKGDAVELRRLHLVLKGGRITNVLQARPSKIEYRKLYQVGEIL